MVFHRIGALSARFEHQRFYSLLHVLIILLSITLPAPCSWEQVDLSEGLPQGLKLHQYQWDRWQCVFYVAEIERNSTLHFEVAVAGATVLGRETVSSIVNRIGDRVIVAATGGFGIVTGPREGVLKNVFVQDGEIVTSPVVYPNEWQRHSGDACFGVTKSGKFLVGRVKIKATFQIGDAIIQIDGINVERKYGRSVVLYTPRFGDSTRTGIPPRPNPRANNFNANSRAEGFEVILYAPVLPVKAGYESVCVIKDIRNGGNTNIPKDGFVLSIEGNKSKLPVFLSGATGKLNISFAPKAWNNVVHGIGGNWRLIENGDINPKIVENHQQSRLPIGKQLKRDQVASYEPRTALGFNAEKLFLILADGRQRGYSLGMPLYELAEILQKLGATEAINLDGGSSATLIVDGKVINRPSKGKERVVLNAVMITSN